MCIISNARYHLCELISMTFVNSEVFLLHFYWNGPVPEAGQFFMIKPERSSVFLARPISLNEYNPAQGTLKFLIAIKGGGTKELSQMHRGDKAELTGPFGNKWADFLPERGKVALVGGSAGVAPLAALVAEKPDYHFHFYAGFRKGFRDKEEEDIMMGAAKNARKVVVTAEDGRNAMSGRIVDYLFEPKDYDAVFACGSLPMLKSIKHKCETKGNIPLFISMERRMACGVGACLGCTIITTKGNRRCCVDGPIFAAEDLNLNE